MQVAELSLEDRFKLYFLSAAVAIVGFLVVSIKFPIVAKVFCGAFFGLLIGLLLLCAAFLAIGLVVKSFWSLFETIWGTKESPFNWKQRSVRFIFVLMAWLGMAFGLMGIGSPSWLAWLTPFATTLFIFVLVENEEEERRKRLWSRNLKQSFSK